MPTFCRLMHEEAHWAICGFFKVLASLFICLLSFTYISLGTPKSIYSLIMNLDTEQQRHLMKKICDYLADDELCPATAFSKSPFVTSIFSSTSLSLLIIMRPSFVETADSLRQRKELQNFVLSYKDLVHQFLQFSIDSVLPLIEDIIARFSNPCKDEMVAIDGFNYLLNLLEFLSRDESNANELVLSRYEKKLQNFRRNWIKLNDRMLCESFQDDEVGFDTSSFTELAVSSPVAGYKPDGRLVVTLHSFWSILCVSLFLSRIQRYSNSTNPQELQILIKLLHHTIENSKTSLYDVQQNHGRFQAHTTSALLLINEIQKYDNFQDTIDINSLKAKVLYYRAKGRRLLDISPHFTAELRKKLVLEDIEQARDVTGVDTKTKEKIQKFLATFRPDNACAHCMACRPSLLRCSKCKKVFYCNRDCQKQDWQTHKLRCK